MKLLQKGKSSHEIFMKCRCERKNLAYFRQKNRNRQILQKLLSLNGHEILI